MDTTSDTKATVEAANINAATTAPMPSNTADGMTATEADTTATNPSNPIVVEHEDAATNKAVAKPQPEAETEIEVKDQVPEAPVADSEDIDGPVEQSADKAKQKGSGEEASQPTADREDDPMDIDENPPTAPAPKSKSKGKARMQVVAVGEVAFESPVTKKEMLAFLDQHSIEAYPVKQTWIRIARKLLQDQSDLPLSKAQMLARLDKYAINATKETLVYIEVARRLINSLEDNSAPKGKSNGGEPTPKRKRDAEVSRESQASEVKRQKPNVTKSEENSEKSKESSKQTKENSEQSKENSKQSKENSKESNENSKKSKENSEKSAENSKQSEENSGKTKENSEETKENSENSKANSKQIEQEPKVAQEEFVKGRQNQDDQEAQFRQASTWTSSDGRMNMQSGFLERGRRRSM